MKSKRMTISLKALKRLPGRPIDTSMGPGKEFTTIESKINELVDGYNAILSELTSLTKK